MVKLLKKLIIPKEGQKIQAIESLNLLKKDEDDKANISFRWGTVQWGTPIYYPAMSKHEPPEPLPFSPGDRVRCVKKTEVGVPIKDDIGIIGKCYTVSSIYRNSLNRCYLTLDECPWGWNRDAGDFILVNNVCDCGAKELQLPGHNSNCPEYKKW